MSRRSLPAVGASMLAFALVGALPAVAGTPTPGSDTLSVRPIPTTVPDPVAYWTPQRMAAASPMPMPATSTPTSDTTEDATADANAAPEVLAAPDPVSGDAVSPEVSGKYFNGLRYIGTLFGSNGKRDHFCTASVINSWHHDLLITAAHCAGNIRNAVFVPEYHNGHQPYGVWTLSTAYFDKRWTEHHDIDLDFAFVRVNTLHGRKIQRVLGGNGLALDWGFVNRATVIGYPDKRYDPKGDDRPIYCTNTTHRVTGYRYQVEFDCDGYQNGTSGSPWILDYDHRTGYGYTNGVIGGLDAGGPTPSINYTSYFDHDIATLYRQAQAHS